MTSNELPKAHREFLADDRTARQIALAFTRFRVTRPSFLLLAAIEIGLGITFLVAGDVLFSALFGVVVVLVIVAVLVTIPRMERVLRLRGYEAGGSIATDYFDEYFTITTSFAPSMYRYTDIRSLRIRGGVATIRTRLSSAVVLLPAELVPDEVRPALQGGAH